MTDSKLLEKLSELEHEQWEAWANTIINAFEQWIEEGKKMGLGKEELASYYNERLIEQIKKWKVNIKPYAELSDDVKEFDRKWAKIVLKIVTNS